jgi:hypothetical protein
LAPVFAFGEEPDVLDPLKSTKLESIRCELEGGETIEMALTEYYPEGDDIHAWYRADGENFHFKAGFYSPGMSYSLEIPQMAGVEQGVLDSRVYWHNKLVLHNPPGGRFRGYTCFLRLKK